jgi:A/G-specific adenine glycosylase
MKLSNIQLFQDTVKDYYLENSRKMPWRENTDPYWILVSEMMLQQTQVDRVIPKFTDFIDHFPDITYLANSPFRAILEQWSGLGYNRRAQYLHKTAKIILSQYNGQIPEAHDKLLSLPGIGPNTAGAIQAYAFNRPVVFLETNIRTVMIHHFFTDQARVDDWAVATMVEQTLDQDNPREWYWALMDYGSWLKKTVGNRSQQSSGYAKQSRFEGSRRQVRGQILRELLKQPLTQAALMTLINDNRIESVLEHLVDEKIIEIDSRNHYRITS